MAIDNPVLLSFCNETIRSTADKLAGILVIPEMVLSAAVGQGVPEVLGTTNQKLLQSEAWTDADYAEATLQTITGSDSGGRTLLTNHHVIGILRVLTVVKAMIDSNTALRPLVGAVAVNPRA